MSTLTEAIFNAFLWSALSLVPAVAVWPLFRRWFPETIAWGAARLFAPALTAYVIVFPCVVTGVMPFTRVTILCAIAFLAVIARVTGPRRSRLGAAERRHIKAFEIFYTAALIITALFMTRIPSAVGMGERMRDSAIWTAIWVQQRFPFDDPWLSGSAIRYYVFGYLPHAAVALFTPLLPLGAYSLALAATATQYASALFLVFRAFQLTALQAAAGAALVFLGSNLKSLVQAGDVVLKSAEYNWWEPSRVIKNTINEFPLWTATLGDLHPHYLCLYLFPMLLAMAAAFLFRSEEADEDGKERAWLAASALVVAWLWGSNTWEVPVGFGAAILAMTLARRGLGAKAIAFRAAAFLGAVVVLAAPFIRTGSRTERAFGLVKVPSTPKEMWMTFGLFFIPILGFPIMRWWKSAERREWVWGAALIVVFSFGSAQAIVFLTAGLLLLCFGFLWDDDEEMRQAYAPAIFGFAILIACELFHLKDVYGDQNERLNTVFKFYMPTWTALGVAAVLLGRRWKSLVPARVFPVLAGLWAVSLAAHLVFGVYARTGGYRSNGPADGLGEIESASHDDAELIRWIQPRVLDGELSGVLLEATGGGYSLLTRFSSTTGLKGFAGWEGYGFWSIYGLNDAVGERMKHVNEFLIESGKGRDVAGVTDCTAFRGRLHAAGIDYVAIGSVERKKYSAESLGTIEKCLELVHAQGEAKLLAVNAK